jgi:predicted nucleotidyltransferase
MDFGLPKTTLDEMNAIFQKFADIEKVIIYGSRAKGNYKYNSDIDMTIFAQNFSHDRLLHLLDDFYESNIPYLTDISLYDKIDNEDLKAHINRVGKVIYQRETAI